MSQKVAFLKYDRNVYIPYQRQHMILDRSIGLKRKEHVNDYTTIA